MRWIKRVVFLLIAVLAVGALALSVLPWKPWVEGKLKRAIEDHGVTPVTLTLDHVGLKGAALKDVTLGEPALKLSNLTIGYRLRALLRGELGEITLQGLSLELTQQPEGWRVAGLEGLMAQAPKKEGTTTIPVSRAEISTRPLPPITLREGTVQVNATGWNATLPLNMTLRQSPSLTATVTSKGISGQVGTTHIASEAVDVALALDEDKKQWQGKWSVDALSITSETLPLPKLKATGDIAATAENATITGKITDASKTHHARFVVEYSLAKPETSRLLVEEAAMPWGGGSVSLGKVTMPFNAKKPITFSLKANKVELAPLMQALTGNSATATGVVSGSIPITYAPGGKLTIGQGALTAEAPGIISLSPDAIPGDNPQVGMVRDVLKNLHYEVLALELGMDDGHMLNARLRVEGKNPDVEKGRPIKLQVNLSGDLLNLLLQNIKLMTDPTQFIEKNTHEKDSD